MSPWTFKAMWPVEDDEAGTQEMRAFAETELPTLAEEAGARLIGKPSWEVVENDPARWPHTDLVLVAVAPALPVGPTREQYADLVRHYAGQGWCDREIGHLLGVPRNSVAYVRRANQIRPGASAGKREAA